MCWTNDIADLLKELSKRPSWQSDHNGVAHQSSAVSFRGKNSCMCDFSSSATDLFCSNPVSFAQFPSLSVLAGRERQIATNHLFKVSCVKKSSQLILLLQCGTSGIARTPPHEYSGSCGPPYWTDKLLLSSPKDTSLYNSVYTRNIESTSINPQAQTTITATSQLKSSSVMRTLYDTAAYYLESVASIKVA